MPVHNAGNYLKIAVDSILSQRGVIFELLIINDHSDDGAIEALEKNQLISVLTSPKRGIVSALNIGVGAAKYPFIARMDADDISEPARLVTQLEHLLNNPNLDICGCKVSIFSEAEEIGDGYRYYESWINNLCKSEDIERDFFIESPIPHPTAMLRKDLLLSLGGYHESAWPEDYDLWFRALLSGAKFGKPKEAVLLKWRDHQYRISRTDQRYSKQQFLQCKAHYLSKYLLNRNINKCIIAGSGSTGLKMHDYLSAKGIDVNAFIDIDHKLIGRTRRSKAIHVVSEETTSKEIKKFISMDSSIIISAANTRGARQKIRQYLQSISLSETEEFIIT